MDAGLYARFDTSKGQILIALTFKQTPGTVGNFVALAEGNQPNDEKPKGPYYDGLKFHRVIPDFMIQGVARKVRVWVDLDYQFADEFVDALKHDKPGTFYMAMLVLEPMEVNSLLLMGPLHGWTRNTPFLVQWSRPRSGRRNRPKRYHQ